MKIFSCSQIKNIDVYTIENEPVKSIDLMERAALGIYKWIIESYPQESLFFVFVGPGNNGGDGLAISRLLTASGYKVKVFFVDQGGRKSPDWEINKIRLENETTEKLIVIKEINEFPLIDKTEIIVDAVFGSGLTRSADGLTAEVIKKINSSEAEVISVDTPSGLFCEDNSSNSKGSIIEADYTLSFQFPKLSFMFAENHKYTGEVVVLPIGLHPDAINNIPSPFSLIENHDVKTRLKQRSRFDHKGVFGHGLLMAGSYGKIGSAVLGAQAAARSGIGLISCYVPSCGYQILQTSVPEAMVLTDNNHNYISSAINTEPFSAIGIGPGIGTEPLTQKALFDLLKSCKKPMVLDADALNILSLNKEWLKLLPAGTVLTPHPKEFERLAGVSTSGYEKFEKQMKFSHDYNCIVLLKGSNSSVSTPGGRVFFNSTGNPGMATGGSGDVLTGIILSLLAQGYSPENAAIAGAYLHGLAGDLALRGDSKESLIASDIINNTGNAFNKIRQL
jgi:hydroxyethylthiazole kinase-like uncharacterized protein yjeF